MDMHLKLIFKNYLSVCRSTYITVFLNACLTPVFCLLYPYELTGNFVKISNDIFNYSFYNVVLWILIAEWLVVLCLLSCRPTHLVGGEKSRVMLMHVFTSQTSFCTQSLSDCACRTEHVTHSVWPLCGCVTRICHFVSLPKNYGGLLLITVLYPSVPYLTGLLLLPWWCGPSRLLPFLQGEQWRREGACWKTAVLPEQERWTHRLPRH